MPSISVRQATIEDLTTVSSVLSEVALWLNERNMTLWEETEIGIEVLRQDIKQGLFYIANNCSSF